MMEAKDIDYAGLVGEGGDFEGASADGRAFAVSGGVATAVVNAIHRDCPDLEVKVANAEGLDECRKMMRLAVKGKYDGYLLEGMACPGGCVAGPGTLQPIARTAGAVKAYAKKSSRKNATENAYCGLIPELERPEDGVIERAQVTETDEAQKPRV